jgi:hypothetical protein
LGICGAETTQGNVGKRRQPGATRGAEVLPRGAYLAGSRHHAEYLKVEDYVQPDRERVRKGLVAARVDEDWRLGCTSRPGLTVHPYVHSRVISELCMLTAGSVKPCISSARRRSPLYEP